LHTSRALPRPVIARSSPRSYMLLQ